MSFITVVHGLDIMIAMQDRHNRPLKPLQICKDASEKMCTLRAAKSIATLCALIILNALALQGSSFTPMALGLSNIGLVSVLSYLSLSESKKNYRSVNNAQQTAIENAVTASTKSFINGQKKAVLKIAAFMIFIFAALIIINGVGCNDTIALEMLSVLTLSITCSAWGLAGLYKYIGCISSAVRHGKAAGSNLAALRRSS